MEETMKNIIKPKIQKIIFLINQELKFNLNALK